MKTFRVSLTASLAIALEEWKGLVWRRIEFQ